jgi:hypothetical protein
MRHIAIVVTALLAAAPAAAQTPVPELHPYGLDPYKPSDAALLRTYGGTLLAQTPVLELRQLDPYKPSHADLLRQLGNGIPQWSHFNWYPAAPVPAPLMLPSMPPAMSAAGDAIPAGNNVVVILVPPTGPLVPRATPEHPREALPVPPLPRKQAPDPVPGGPVRARPTPEQAAETLRRLAYQTHENGSAPAMTGAACLSPAPNASSVDATNDQAVEP